jgi:two-component system response regulator NreC
MGKITVLVADDHAIVRKGLCSVLNEDEGIEVVAEAEDGKEALEKALRLRPDLVVMDISMPVLDGLKATCQIRKQLPEVKVLILTMHPPEEYVLQALRAGASGYIIKEAVVAELVSAVRAICRGDAFVCPSLSRKELDDYIRRAEANGDNTGRDEPAR